MSELSERLRRGWAGLKGMGLTRNLGLKAIALVLGFAVWFMIVSREKAELELSVPLKIENVPAGWTIAGHVPETVSVRLTGPRSTLQRITPADVSTRVDLSRAQQGEQIWLLDRESVSVPFGVEVARITPPQLILRLEETLTKKVPILPNLTGEVPSGHVVTETTVDPPEARVRAAGSVLDDTNSVTTQPVPLGGRRNSFTIPVRVLSPRSDVEVVDPAEATVRVRIEERITQRSLAVPVETRGQARGRVQINPSDLSVTLAGPNSQISALQAGDLSIVVDVDRLEPRGEDYHLKPEVALRKPEAFPAVQIVDSGQPRVDVHVYPVTSP